MDNIIWIAWEKHRRTEQLVDFLDIKSFLLESNKSRCIRHPFFIVKTLFILVKENPKILIVQNPSIILSLLTCILKKLRIFKYFLVVDSHNEGIFPYGNKFKFLECVYGFIQKTADLTIVTNINLAEIIDKNNGNKFVLPDIIPTPETINNIKLAGQLNYVLICTFAKDEPFLQVIEAAKTLSVTDRLYITGNYQKIIPDLLSNLPEQVILTGYLTDYDYWGFLKSADFIVDLTLMSDCLVCGAYEAISVGTPMILSDSNMLKEHFYKGAIFTDNTTRSIIASFAEAKEKQKILIQEIAELKYEYEKFWINKGNQLKKILSDILVN